MVALLRQIKPEIAIIAGIIASAGILIAVFTGKGKTLPAGTWVIGGLFAVMFLVTH